MGLEIRATFLAGKTNSVVGKNQKKKHTQHGGNRGPQGWGLYTKHQCLLRNHPFFVLAFYQKLVTNKKRVTSLGQTPHGGGGGFPLLVGRFLEQPQPLGTKTLVFFFLLGGLGVPWGWVHLVLFNLNAEM